MHNIFQKSCKYFRKILFVNVCQTLLKHVFLQLFLFELYQLIDIFTENDLMMFFTHCQITSAEIILANIIYSGMNKLFKNRCRQTLTQYHFITLFKVYVRYLTTDRCSHFSKCAYCLFVTVYIE